MFTKSLEYQSRNPPMKGMLGVSRDLQQYTTQDTYATNTNAAAAIMTLMTVDTTKTTNISPKGREK